MKVNKRLAKIVAPIAAIATVVAVSSLLLATPAEAAWPSAFKVCNATDSSDTNGGSADGANIDVDRAAEGGTPAYSNELVPGECTGSTLTINPTQTSLIRIDFTDDGANTGLDSVQVGIDEDGIDDSQGPYDGNGSGGCIDTNAISNENNWAMAQVTAEHQVGSNGIDVRIRDAQHCGMNEADHAQICNHASSADTNGGATDGKNIDVVKTDASYSNELVPGECTNYKDIDGSNPLRVDLSDDGANTTIEFDSFVGGESVGGCQQGDTSTGDPGLAFNDLLVEAGVDVPHSLTYRLYTPDSPDTTLCGVTVPAAGSGESAIELLPTCNPPSPTADTDQCEDTSTPADP